MNSTVRAGVQDRVQAINRRFPANQVPVDTYIDRLIEERRQYSRRINQLASMRGKDEEIAGYVRLIDNINAACLRIAAGARLPAAA